MIDSNTLTQIGGTLRAMQELDNERAQNIGAGAFGALRLYGRKHMDDRRREVDRMKQLEGAITLANNRKYLEDSGYGSDLYEAELAAQGDKKNEFIASQATPFADEWGRRLNEWRGGFDQNAESYRNANNELELTDDDLNNIIANTDVRQSAKYVWDPSTDIVALKPEAGKWLSDEEIDKLLAEEYQKRKDAWDAGEANKLGQVWDEANPLEVLTGDARTKREKELFDKDFHEKMLSYFNGDEKALQEFMELENDPRFTTYDQGSGRMRLKRPDELYFDLGNMANFWAPEMAEPYFNRAKDLTDLLRGSYGTFVNNLKALHDDYEIMHQHANQRVDRITEAISNAEIGLRAARDAGDKLAQEKFTKTLDVLNQDLEEATRANQLAQEEYGRKSTRATDLLAVVSGMKPEEWASTRFYGDKTLRKKFPLWKGGDKDLMEALYSEIAGSPSVTRAPTTNEEIAQRQASQDAYRKAMTYTGENAQRNIMNSGLPAQMSVAQLNSAMKAADMQQEHLLRQRQENQGQKGERANQPFSLKNFMALRNANTYDGLISAVEMMLNDMRSGNVNDNASIGAFSLKAGQTENRAANTNNIRNMSPSAFASAVKQWFGQHWWPKDKTESAKLYYQLMQNKRAADEYAKQGE